MNYDVIVIGSGPGGYVAAIRSAQLGFKTAIIEKYNSLGGTCLNVGCIPSKSLLDSSEHFYNAKHNFEEHGISVSKLNVDFTKMVDRKKNVVDQISKGVEYLMSKNKIDVIRGIGSFVSNTQIKVSDIDGKELFLEGKNIIIATGSKPLVPDSFNYDKNRVITSTEALKLKEIPKHMAIIGAGVIGLELGSVYSRLGTKVEVIENANSLLSTMDVDLGKELQKVLKKLGIIFHLNHTVSEVVNLGDKVKIVYHANDEKNIKELESDYCLVAIGRKAYTEKLGLEAIGIKTNEKGQIIVDSNLRSNIPNVYAIGDVVSGVMLAHKASEEGIFVAEVIAGQLPHINYDLIPGVIYTWPEVASVGKTETQLKNSQIPYQVGKFPIKALGRAKASGDTEGFVKILAHKQTDEILGIHIIGARAADLIAEAVASMEFRASAEDLAIFSHAHPTYAEALKEAAMDATGKRAIHM